MVSHYTNESKYHWLILVLHLLVSFHLLKNYYTYLPYYVSVVSTTYGACCLGYVWVTVNVMLIKALESVEYRGQIIVIVIGFLFLYPTSHYLRKDRIH